MNGERMHAVGKFLRQSRVDRSVPLDSALAAKSFRYDIDAVVRFPARTMSGMTSMQMRLVFDAEAFRRESFRQFLCDDIFRLHRLTPDRAEWCYRAELLETRSISEMSSLEPERAFFAY